MPARVRDTFLFSRLSRLASPGRSRTCAMSTESARASQQRAYVWNAQTIRRECGTRRHERDKTHRMKSVRFTAPYRARERRAQCVERKHRVRAMTTRSRRRRVAWVWETIIVHYRVRRPCVRAHRASCEGETNSRHTFKSLLGKSI